MDPEPQSSTPNTPATQRKRRRKSRDRVRVTRACDQCKRQKIRCTGAQPCQVCTRKGTHCSYDASYSRGRAPSITFDDNNNNNTGQITTPHVSVEEQLPPGISLQPEFRTEPPVSSRPSPEPSQTDRQGHYVGPASGVSFLLRVQRRVHHVLQSPQTSSIFTFGDAPLPEFDASFFMVPRKEDTKQLLERYFDFAVPTHRFLHRPTIETWHEEFYATSGSMTQQDEAPAKIAVLFMVFAQASLYMPTTTNADAASMSNTSVRYFLAADLQLGREKGHVRLTSVQARLAQCFYLLSQSRINHCWSLFGTTSQLALAIGLHRGRRTDSLYATRRVEIECRRRVFWCAYTLDKYLSGALGRPRTFREEDIDQELPSCVDDADLLLSEACHHRQISHSQPLMRAAVAHIKLSRVLDGILRDLYPIGPLSTTSRLDITAQYMGRLKEWYNEVEDFLDSRRTNTALLLPIYQRQRNVLNLAYQHATILANRPFLLRKLGMVQKGRHASVRSSAQDQRIDQCIGECVNAAMEICGLVSDLINANVMFRAFWFTSYYAFCAVVVVYVYIIQKTPSSPETYEIYSSVANKCQTQLSMIAEENSLAARYCLVLEELRKETIHQSKETHGNHPNHIDGVNHQREEHSPQQPDQIQILSGDLQNTMETVEASAFGVSPGSSLHDISGWGVFDSMVTSGLGNLGNFLEDGSFTF